MCQGGRVGRRRKKAGEKEGRQIDFLRDLCHYFLSGPLARRRRTLRHGVVGDTTVSSARRAVFQLAPRVSLRFWHAARIPRDINATGNTVESFNQSAPMTLGIRPRVIVQLRNETLRPIRRGSAQPGSARPGPKWAFVARIKKWLIELPVLTEPCTASLCTRGARFNGHHISNVSVRANEG